MSVLGSIVLLFGGLSGLAAAWNAARPVFDPTRRYSPRWLPAMVTTELAPLWFVLNAAAFAFGSLLGGLDHVAGRVGAVSMAVTGALLVALMVRSRIAVRRLRPWYEGEVPPARGRARVIGRSGPPPAGVREAHGVEWLPGLTLDIVRPAGDTASAPVLVYVHGGGWTGGDPQHQARDLYHALALDGWVVVAVRYPFTPGVSVETQIDTIRAAVRWARHGLRDHGVIAERVALAGGSAGAHLAAMAALTSVGEDEGVDAFVGIYGVYDMANRTPTRAHWDKIRDEVMLQTVADAPDRYRAVSPVDRIDETSPPMLLVHGTRDTLVPVGEAELFAGALRAAGRPVDLVTVLGAEHAFDAISSITTRTTAAVIRTWLNRTIDRPPG